MELGITFCVMLSAGLLIGIAQWFESFKYAMITLLTAIIAVAFTVSVNPIPSTTSMVAIHIGAILLPPVFSGMISWSQQRSLKKVSH